MSHIYTLHHHTPYCYMWDHPHSHTLYTKHKSDFKKLWKLKEEKKFFFYFTSKRKEYIWLSMIYVYPSIICSSTIHFNNQYDLFYIQTSCKMLRNCKRVVLYALFSSYVNVIHVYLKKKKKKKMFHNLLCNTLRLLYILLSLTPFCWRKKNSLIT